MNAHEHTDPAGDGLTITHDDGRVWITCTSKHAEVTVGPLPADILDGEQHEDTIKALRAEVDEMWPLRKRAEKAEQRLRRLARALDLPDAATADDMVARIEEINAGIVTREPITVTDEMVERIQQWALALRAGGTVYLGTKGAVREMFAAALTEPTERDPRAVALDADMRTWEGEDDFPDQWLDGLADHLARLGWTKGQS